MKSVSLIMILIAYMGDECDVAGESNVDTRFASEEIYRENKGGPSLECWDSKIFFDECGLFFGSSRRSAHSKESLEQLV